MEEQELEMWNMFFKGLRVMKKYAADDKSFNFDHLLLSDPVYQKVRKNKAIIKRHDSSSSSDSMDMSKDDNVDDGIHAFRACLNHFEKLKMFSSIDFVGNVRGGRVVLLLCEAFLARLMMYKKAELESSSLSGAGTGARATTSSDSFSNFSLSRNVKNTTVSSNTSSSFADPEAKKAQLLKAYELNTSFLRRASQAGVLDSDSYLGYRVSLAIFVSKKEEFEAHQEGKEITGSSSRILSLLNEDVSMIPAMRAERFKTLPTIEKLLIETEQKLQRAIDSDDKEGIDKYMREANLLIIQNASNRCLNELDIIFQELDVINGQLVVEAQARKDELLSAFSSHSVSASVAST